MRRRVWLLAAVVAFLLTACGDRPPDGAVWQEGREYHDPNGAAFTVKRLPKVDGGWHRIDMETIRYEPFHVYKVAGEDDAAFFVKIYAPVAVTTTTVPDPAAIAATYAVSTRASERFVVEEIGAGLPHGGQWRQRFAMADVDGDGHLDIVHGPRRKGGRRPVVLRGDGRGGFALWSDVTVPDLPYDYGGLAVADFDGNGTADLALACHLHGITVLAGDGKGTFTTYADGLVLREGGEPGVGGRISSRAIAAVDWNGDGAPDLVVLPDGPVRFEPTRQTPGQPPIGRGMHVFLNEHGTWRLLAPAPSDAEDALFGDALAVADVDADGMSEVIAASNALGMTNLLRRRTPAGWESRPLEGVRPAAVVQSVATGDFDGDGRTDVVLGWLGAEGGAWRAGIDLLYARPDGFERRAIAMEESRRGVPGLATGDFDGDGALDLVAVRADGVVETFAGDGAGFVTRDAIVPVAAWRTGCEASDVRTGDLDGDGTSEIVASFAGERAGLDLSPRPVCPSGGGLAAWKIRRR